MYFIINREIFANPFLAIICTIFICNKIMWKREQYFFNLLLHDCKYLFNKLSFVTQPGHFMLPAQLTLAAQPAGKSANG